MLGPGASSTRLRDEADRDARPNPSADSDTECELCQSERSTTVRYGLRVCLSCEDEYLP